MTHTVLVLLALGSGGWWFRASRRLDALGNSIDEGEGSSGESGRARAGGLGLRVSNLLLHAQQIRHPPEATVDAPTPTTEVIARTEPTLTSHSDHQLPPTIPGGKRASASAIDPGCLGCVVLLSGRVWRLLHGPRPTGGSRVLPGAGAMTPQTPRPQASAKTPAISIRKTPATRPGTYPTRKLRASIRCIHNTAYMQGNPSLLRCRRQIAESRRPQGFESGGTTTRGESPDFGVAQLFQREPVS